MKHAIFIVGQRKSGKSTIIRSLTGFGRRKKGELWRLRSLNDKYIKALVVLNSPQELGMKEKHAPSNFPEYFENSYEINREDYDILICPLELNVINNVYSYEEYVKVAQKKEFCVGMVAINKRWNGVEENKAKMGEIQKFATTHGKQLILVDASDDPNVIAGKIRQKLYP